MLLTIPLLLCFASSSVAHPFKPSVRGNASRITGKCGTGPPSSHLREAHATLHHESRESRLQPRKAGPANEIIVDTYIHFVTTFDQASHFTPEDIAAFVASQVNNPSLLYLPFPLLIPFVVRPHSSLPNFSSLSSALLFSTLNLN